MTDLDDKGVHLVSGCELEGHLLLATATSVVTILPALHPAVRAITVPSIAKVATDNYDGSYKKNPQQG
eukprot:4469766-Amphidinium_carterae.1